MTDPKSKLETPECKDAVSLTGLALAGYNLTQGLTHQPDPAGQAGLKLGEAVIREKCGVSPQEASAYFRAQKSAPPKP